MPALVQQGQTNGRRGKQPLILDVDRNQPGMEHGFKKQNGKDADADRQIAFPCQRHAIDIGDDIRNQTRAEQKR